MIRILVVANQTLGGPNVMSWLRERAAREPCRIHLLVPANVDTQSWTNDDDSDRELAAQRLSEGIERFSELDSEITGEIGDPRPMDAVSDVLRREDFDEILLSTLPPGMSRWLRLDLVHRLERTVAIPVTHIVTHPAGAASGGNPGRPPT
jgi:hypothetical protein